MLQALHTPAVNIPDEPLSWDLIARTEVQLRELLNNPPRTRKRTEVAAWTNRVKAYERWIHRASGTLQQLENQAGHQVVGHQGTRHPQRPGVRTAQHQNTSSSTEPQTLGDYVLQNCGANSDEWKNFQRINRLFGVDSPAGLEKAKERERALLEKYGLKPEEANG